MELMVLKSCITSLLSVRKQKDEIEFKQDKAKDRLVATQARAKDLREQESEIELELAQLESCMNELMEMPEEEDELMPGGGGEPSASGFGAAPPGAAVYASAGLTGPLGPPPHYMW
eukprot:4097997-Pyramimonas_sp.AAC.1